MPEQGDMPSFGMKAQRSADWLGLALESQRSADRLALALEEVGFDVGRSFPMLGGTIDPHREPGVQLGQVAASVADQLSTVLTQAARLGVTISGADDWPEAAGAAGGP